MNVLDWCPAHKTGQLLMCDEYVDAVRLNNKDADDALRKKGADCIKNRFSLKGGCPKHVQNS